MRNVIILGLTGTIGQTALRGCSIFTDEITITGASCHNNTDKAFSLCLQHGIKNLCITGKTEVSEIPCGINVWYDLKEMLQALKADIVLNGIAGSPGLEASFRVIESHSTLALANKESVVLGGHLLSDYAKKHNVLIIPVDSEHSAIDELLMAHRPENTDKLVITASGGPFRDKSPEELEHITPEIAVKHPTWKMGPKISIDSSTLANKGLEVIEAHYLFGFDADHIQVVIHPQSVVHSMIRTLSGQVYAQMSPPDMVFPIMRALMWPKVERQVGKALDFTNLDLSFRELDPVRFPFVPDAFRCVRLEGSYPIVYNTANEIAVAAFMNKEITYPRIHTVVNRVLDSDWSFTPASLEDILYIQDKISRNVKL